MMKRDAGVTLFRTSRRVAILAPAEIVVGVSYVVQSCCAECFAVAVAAAQWKPKN